MWSGTRRREGARSGCLRPGTALPATAVLGRRCRLRMRRGALRQCGMWYHGQRGARRVPGALRPPPTSCTITAQVRQSYRPRPGTTTPMCHGTAADGGQCLLTAVGSEPAAVGVGRGGTGRVVLNGGGGGGMGGGVWDPKVQKFVSQK